MRETSTTPRFGNGFCNRGLVFLLLTLLYVVPALGQEVLRDVFKREIWNQYSNAERVAIVAEGFSSEHAEVRQNALAGVVWLIIADSDFARSVFQPRTIREHFYDQEAAVVRTAFWTYSHLVEDAEEYESAVVQRALMGGGPLANIDYVGLLYQYSSHSARDWLLSVIQTTTDRVTRVEAIRALVSSINAPEPPPQFLLPDVMEIIRSPDYFCHPSLTQSLPKFGPPAAAHLDELRVLRGELQAQSLLPVLDRSVRILGNDRMTLETMDRAIAELERL